ncbi:hypothetical protein DAX59_23800, partial [Salmonella enterica subsp. enterica]
VDILQVKSSRRIVLQFWIMDQRGEVRERSHEDHSKKDAEDSPEVRPGTLPPRRVKNGST